ncbi:putative periplasmic protein [Sulfurospirillum diekertiae]|uniref:Periplasmic protein n=1 Tax=Sulfurospirillum diekertiae TaxID=1854492 RepID=A0A290HCU7_9BACT|nr:hypothetical protein [Sulfurospirillum diekertiae]ATB69277.1 putative periplasmic protein [Sulfurospirillum diekertiae]
MQKVFLTIFLIPSLLVCASNLFDENQPLVAVGSCMERIEIKNSHTPVDLFKSSAKCIEEEKYPQAVELYLVATAYGYFDSARVVDKSTRQSLDTLKTEIFGPLDATKRNQFAEALRARLDDMKSSCNFLEKLGKPTYYPKYLVENGVTRGDGLILNYDAKALWDDTRFEYLKCP